MTMTRIQRDAMQRAQHGDWGLADAIEVLARHESDSDLIGGIRRGGRLQLLAYRHYNYLERLNEAAPDSRGAACAAIACCGVNEPCAEGNCDCCCGVCACGGDDGQLSHITDLNGTVLFDVDHADSDGYPPPWWAGVDITVPAASAIVSAYTAAVARPTQTTLIPEPV